MILKRFLVGLSIDFERVLDEFPIAFARFLIRSPLILQCFGSDSQLVLKGFWMDSQPLLVRCLIRFSIDFEMFSNRIPLMLEGFCNVLH